MTTPEVPGQTPPVEARLADRLAARTPPRGAPARTAAVRALEELGQLDAAIYRTIAETPTQTLDRPLRRLSDAADRSKLWLGLAAAMAAVGGRTGRRAAVTGLVAVALDSALVNIGFKFAARRTRPDRDAAGVPADRRVPMPHSASFPSGHAASAFAFATAVAQVQPVAAAPLLLLASAVGYSRVHTGVHYPGDVVIGSLIGAVVGQLVGSGLSRSAAAGAGRPAPQRVTMTGPWSVPVPAARHPVLVINPRSGGGKAERFGLVEQCRARGIEPVLLEQGADLRGARGEGGGRGRGRRGHGRWRRFPGCGRRHGRPARDRHGRRAVGYSEPPGDGPRTRPAGRRCCAGRVRRRLRGADGPRRGERPGVREQRVAGPLRPDRPLAGLPRGEGRRRPSAPLPACSGPGSRPFELRFTGPAGERYTAAHVLQISNNPYGSPPGSIASRPRLDSGLLGVLALELADPAAVKAFLAATAAGPAERLRGVRTWTVTEFKVDADGPLDLGIDGEAVQMAPPLRFTIRPGALRLRVPRHAPGLSPAARQLQRRAELTGLLVRGRTRRLPDGGTARRRGST